MLMSFLLLLVFVVGWIGLVGGFVVVFIIDVVFEDEEFFVGVIVEIFLIVLGDNWLVDIVVVFEVVIIKVNIFDIFIRVFVILVDFRFFWEVIIFLIVDDVLGVLSDDDFKLIDEDLMCIREVVGGKIMVVEGFFMVEYIGIFNNDVDNVIFVEDGNNNVIILFVFIVIKFDLGVICCDEIKVLVENIFIVFVCDIGFLIFFIFEGDGMNVFVEEIVKIMEVKLDMEGLMNIWLFFVEWISDWFEFLIVLMIFDLIEVLVICKLGDDSLIVWVEI